MDCALQLEFIFSVSNTECVCGSGETVFCGSKYGQIVSYTNNETKSATVSKKKKIDKIFPLYPTTQICALSDSCVYCLPGDLSNSGSILIKGGVICMNVDETAMDKPRICVFIKKKIITYTVVTDSTLQKLSEFNVTDGVLQLAWSPPWIILGQRKEYSLLNEETGAIQSLFPMEAPSPNVFTPTGGGGSNVQISVVSSDEVLLIGQENVGFFSLFEHYIQARKILFAGTKQLHISRCVLHI
eukprot:GHVL01039590.1.p1 GENE.GHVL01039590.1~~GHVL01039590.1.p1  ORF type:complete len:270 (-),score=48.94 GHVL01039590.1:520-1245(-)